MPLYRAVKRELLAAIEAGSLPPGATLPSETALAAAWGVSIGTLRHAVDELVAEHLLVRRQGRGTFVATHSEDRFLFQFFHVERADGLREAPQVELIAFERGRADEESASALWLRPGEPLILVENRLRLQGRPVVHDALALPASLFKGLTERAAARAAGHALPVLPVGVRHHRGARGRARRRGRRRAPPGACARPGPGHAGDARAAHGADLRRAAGRVPGVDPAHRAARLRAPAVPAGRLEPRSLGASGSGPSDRPCSADIAISCRG
jgi:hypothetical protein